VVLASLNALGKRSSKSQPFRKFSKDDVALNHATLEMPDQFKVAVFQKKEHPTPERIAANKLK
jgi:hypothetical protein